MTLADDMAGNMRWAMVAMWGSLSVAASATRGVLVGFAALCARGGRGVVSVVARGGGGGGVGGGFGGFGFGGVGGGGVWGERRGAGGSGRRRRGGAVDDAGGATSFGLEQWEATEAHDPLGERLLPGRGFHHTPAV